MSATQKKTPLPDGERESRARQDDEAMAPDEAEKQPSTKPSFASTEDDPLATAGTGGSHDPKGMVRPGLGQVPTDSDEFERRAERLDQIDEDAKKVPKDPKSE